jgi:hypothetical protein
MGRPIAYPATVEIPYKQTSELAKIDVLGMTMDIPSKQLKYGRPSVRRGNGRYVPLTLEQFRQYIRHGEAEYVEESVNLARMIVFLSNQYDGNEYIHMFPLNSD